MVSGELWESPIKQSILSSPPINFGDVITEGNVVYWTETRPEEKGRYALMCRNKKGEIHEKFPFMNVHSKVHEYGGSAFQIFGKAIIVFDSKTSALYYETEEGEVVCLSQDECRRFADFTLSLDKKTVVCVCEDHTLPHIVQNYLVAIDLVTREHTILHSSEDFYAAPKFSPDGLRLAFLSWKFPHMPWEECFLNVALWDKKPCLVHVRQYGNVQESLSQYTWTGGEEIVFASDRLGFSNLYLLNVSRKEVSNNSPCLYKASADFSYPLWTLGKRQFCYFLWQEKRALLCVSCEKGIDSLLIITLDDLEIHRISTPCTVIRTIDVLETNQAVVIGGSALTPLSIWQIDLESFSCEQWRESFRLADNYKPFVPEASQVSVISSVDGMPIFGFYYSPTNPSYAVIKGGVPPLLLRCHGGPTAHATPLLNLDTLFWTSRGFGVLDVNYRGSSGYGKQYREALKGQWGLLDVQDCLDFLTLFLKQKKAVKGKLFARGSSSGGMTALLLAAKGILSGVVSAYGITDLAKLAQATHKFEQYYLSSLVGSAEKYIERSPISYIDQINCPVLCLHGDKDPVVPLSQAQELCNKVPGARLVMFVGEGHGFKGAATQEESQSAELAFYAEILSKSGPPSS